MNKNIYIILLILLVIICIILTIYNLKNNKYDVSNRNKNGIIILIIITILCIIYIIYLNWFGGKNLPWQVNYLNKVYPLGNINTYGPIFFNNLEFIFTDMLPDNIKIKYKNESYKANIPGPSCQQRPCKCITMSNGEKLPDVKFDIDPIWDNKWPPCIFGNIYNQYGTSGLYNWTNNIDTIIKEVGGPCCDSVENAKKCISIMNNINKDDPNCQDWKPGVSNVCTQLGNQRWTSSDAYGGMVNDNIYNPPNMNQIWKPTLHPDYCCVVSKYPKDKWWTFYNKDGNKDDTWLEVIHTFFPLEEQGGDGGVWFYRSIGSGIYINLGKSIRSINKFHMLVLLLGNKIKNNKIEFDEDYGLEKVVEYLLSSYSKDDKRAVIDTINYWEGNLVPLNLSWPIWKYYINKVSGNNVKEKLKNIIKGTYNPKSIIVNEKINNKENIIFLYSINRLANTGGIDQKILSSYIEYQKLNKLIGKDINIRTLQFTIQPNIYYGWTTEILYIGDNYPEKSINNVNNIPKANLRILDTNNIPKNNNIGNSAPCNFDYPLKFLYCDKLKDTWLNPKLNVKDDVTGKEYQGCGN
jgi:hypothetical protein